MEKEKEMARVNARISLTANEWLDKRSATTGISKSSLIMMAVENYIRENEAMAMMSDLGKVVERLESLEKAVKQSGEGGAN